MKRMIVVRHSIKWPNANREEWYIPLSLKGILLALKTGRQLRNPHHFSLAIVSPTIRTILTVILMMVGMRKAIPCKIKPAVSTPWFRRWKSICDQVKSLADTERITLAASLKETDSRLYHDELKRLEKFYKRMFSRLNEGQTALLVGHRPFIEMAVAGLTGQKPEAVPALAECGGYILTLANDGKFTAERFSNKGP